MKERKCPKCHYQMQHIEGEFWDCEYCCIKEHNRKLESALVALYASFQQMHEVVQAYKELIQYCERKE